MQKNKQKKAGQASFDSAQKHSEFDITPTNNTPAINMHSLLTKQTWGAKVITLIREPAQK